MLVYCYRKEQVESFAVLMDAATHHTNYMSLLFTSKFDYDIRKQEQTPVAVHLLCTSNLLAGSGLHLTVVIHVDPWPLQPVCLPIRAL
jgi:hypothetical protein